MAILEGDIILNSDNEITFKDGDVVVGDAPEQHIAAILEASKGNFRRKPTLGADLHNKLDSPGDIRELEQAVRLGLTIDGYRLKALDVNTNGVDEVEIDVVNADKTTDNTGGLI